MRRPFIIALLLAFIFFLVGLACKWTILKQFKHPSPPAPVVAPATPRVVVVVIAPEAGPTIVHVDNSPTGEVTVTTSRAPAPAPVSAPVLPKPMPPMPCMQHADLPPALHTPQPVAMPLPAQPMTADWALAHPLLGVCVGDASPDWRDHHGYERAVLVYAVQPGSPAARAGLQPQDIIVGVEGKPVVWSAEFSQFLGDYARKKIRLTFYRGEEKRDVKVKLRE